MGVFYNDNDAKVCAWLRELINQGQLAKGTVDERDLREIEPADVAGFRRVHWCAGIGGWEYALQLAGWPDDEPVWTVSLPCQPFSAAGKRDGASDERHLWPAWFGIARQLRPRTIFGEQVTGAIGLGWLDRVFADLEGEGYACGSVVLGAHSVGSPHIRQRLFWVADAGHAERREGDRSRDVEGRDVLRREGEEGSAQSRERGEVGGLGDPERDDLGWERGGASGAEAEGARSGDQHGPSGELSGSAGGVRWPGVLIPCGDGKARRVEPGIQPLAHGVPARVVRLRGYGNSIVPQAAAEFVRAFLGT